MFFSLWPCLFFTLYKEQFWGLIDCGEGVLPQSATANQKWWLFHQSPNSFVSYWLIYNAIDQSSSDNYGTLDIPFLHIYLHMIPILTAGSQSIFNWTKSFWESTRAQMFSDFRINDYNIKSNFSLLWQEIKKNTHKEKKHIGLSVIC